MQDITLEELKELVENADDSTIIRVVLDEEDKDGEKHP